MRKWSSIPILLFILVVGVCLSISAHAQKPEAPEVEWSIYVGGSGNDQISDFVIGEDGKLLLAGDTQSQDLTGRINDFQSKHVEGYLSIFSLDEKRIDRSIYFGEGEKLFTAIRSAFYSHGDGIIYVVGSAFPIERPGFVSKIDTDGHVLWSNYIKGNKQVSLHNIVQGKQGNLIILGGSHTDDLPRRLNESSYPVELFLAETTPDGELLWTRYLGIFPVNPLRKPGFAIIEDDLYIVGSSSPAKDYHELWDMADKGYAYLARFSPNGEMRWLTKIEDKGDDSAFGIVIDSQNNIFVVGTTKGIWERDEQEVEDDKLPGALNSRYSIQDAFVAKLNPDGEALWSRYIGGRTGLTEGASIAIDSLDNIYIIGHTTATDLPEKINERREGYNMRDTFIAKLSSEGTYLWSSYLNIDVSFIPNIILKDDHTLYIAGSTASKDLPNRLNEYHEPKEEVEFPHLDIFVAQIRLPVDAEAEAAGDGINNGDRAE